MSTKTTKLVTLGMLFGLLLGCLLGYIVPQFMIATGFIGRLYVNALTIVVIPMILAGAISGVASLGEYRKLGRAGSRTVLYYLSTTSVAAVVALIVAMIVSPGSGVNKSGIEPPALLNAPHARTVGDIVASLIPDNLIQALTNGYFIGLVLLAIAIGMAISRIGSRGRTVIYFSRELMEAIGTIVQGIQYFSAIGLCSIIGTAVALNRLSSDSMPIDTGGYITAAVVAFLIQAVIIIPLFLKAWGKRNVLSFASGMFPAFMNAGGTGSSTATLPITYDCAVGRNQVDNRTASLVLPLGASVNMNGTAIYVVLSTIFVSQVFGVSLSIGQMILLLVTSVVLSFGSSGIPSGGFFLLVAAFGVAGMPPSAYLGLGIILAIDWIADRLRAVLNVWSDAAGAAVVAHSIGRGVQESKSSATPERHARESRDSRDSRDSRGSRPDRPPRRDDRRPFGKPDRSSTPAPSPFAVTTSAETDLEAATAETRQESREQESSQGGRLLRSEHGDRGGRDRQRGRDHEGRDRSRGDRERGDRDQRPDDRGRREGRGRFGDRDRNRGRGRDHDGDRSQNRGPRDNRRFRSDRTSTDQPQPTGDDNQLMPGLSDLSDDTFKNEVMFGSENNQPIESGSQDIFADNESSSDNFSQEIEDKSDDSGDSESPSMEYGRSRSRRHERSDSEGTQSAEASENASESAPANTESAEFENTGPVSFGRSTRKRLKR